MEDVLDMGDAATVEAAQRYNPYRIVYNNVLFTMPRDQVVSAFARLFRIPEDKAAAILARPGTVLRTRLDATTADLYREKLLSIGIDVDVVDASRPRPAVVRAVDVLEEMSGPEYPLADMALLPIDTAPNPDGEIRAAYHGNRQVALDFYGSALAYTALWLTNALLTLCSAGLFLPWAMARSRRYCHANTSLLAVPFQAPAIPWPAAAWPVPALLWLVAVCLLPWRLPPPAGLGALLGLLLVAPVLLVLTMPSRLTLWRDVPLTRVRDMWGAYFVLALPLGLLGTWLGLPLWQAGSGGALTLHRFFSPAGSLLALFLLLGLPYWHWALNRFLVNRCGYGAGSFVFAARPQQYYWLYGCKLPCMTLLAGGLGSVGVQLLVDQTVLQRWTLLRSLPAAAPVEYAGILQQALAGKPGVALLLALLVALVCACWLLAYWRASFFNLRYHAISLGKSHLHVVLRTWPLWQLYVVNALAVLCSAGLLAPWAIIRSLRYRLSCVEVFVSFELDDIVEEARRSFSSNA